LNPDGTRCSIPTATSRTVGGEGGSCGLLTLDAPVSHCTHYLPGLTASGKEG
jgi:hypothetical protein